MTTGEITGAFGFMDYAAVRHFADVYDLQAQFLRTQERQVQDFQTIFAFIPRIVEPKPPSPASVEEWRGRIGSALAGLTFQEQIWPRAPETLRRAAHHLAVSMAPWRSRPYIGATVSLPALHPGLAKITWVLTAEAATPTPMPAPTPPIISVGMTMAAPHSQFSAPPANSPSTATWFDDDAELIERAGDVLGLSQRRHQGDGAAHC